MKDYDLIVVGGGAAGFFSAIQCKERNRDLSVIILEKSNKLLSKVRISGGGRCNVTHACFDPKEMIQNYPRGAKELLGPFNRFLCGDMMAWLEDNGVPTKIEADGRVFPKSNSSETIINLFLDRCEQLGISIRMQEDVKSFKKEDDHWLLKTPKKTYQTNNVLLATGSSKSMWQKIALLGHEIIEPVPSLFTFNIKNKLLKELQGVSVPSAEVRILGSKYHEEGPLLITHWGLSGPAILKLSAIAARELAFTKYKFQISVNWCIYSSEEIYQLYTSKLRTRSLKKISNDPLAHLPKRLWLRMVDVLSLQDKNYHDLSKNQIEKLIALISTCEFQVIGKSTYKDEFVTAGGVETSELNFRTMESRLFTGLYFAGEVINIDAVTGGFNFQACWTESYIAAESIAAC